MATTTSSLCLIAAGLLALIPSAAAETPADCRRENDDGRRLACYDALFGKAPGEGTAETPAVPAEARLREPASPLGTFWELAPADKRGSFVVRTYHPNFLLPLHYSSSVNRRPESPTQPALAAREDYRAQDAKFQISLRAKLAEGLLLPNADLWFAYTQRSQWQLWNSRQSSPFRSTDYQPEAIYVVPVPRSWGSLPGGWRLPMVQLGVGHQSNGQADPLSRSWNFMYAGTALEREDVVLQLRGYRRLQEAGGNDNPDLLKYIGDTEIVASWLPGLSTASLAWRINRRSLSRGSLQLDWTYPVNRARPDGLRWYVQLFSGYGETLLDYNHRQTSVGVGLSLFQF